MMRCAFSLRPLPSLCHLFQMAFCPSAKLHDSWSAFCWQMCWTKSEWTYLFFTIAIVKTQNPRKNQCEGVKQTTKQTHKNHMSPHPNCRFGCPLSVSVFGVPALMVVDRVETWSELHAAAPRPPGQSWSKSRDPKNSNSRLTVEDIYDNLYTILLLIQYIQSISTNKKVKVKVKNEDIKQIPVWFKMPSNFNFLQPNYQLTTSDHIWPPIISHVKNISWYMWNNSWGFTWRIIPWLLSG